MNMRHEFRVTFVMCFNRYAIRVSGYKKTLQFDKKSMLYSTGTVEYPLADTGWENHPKSITTREVFDVRQLAMTTVAALAILCFDLPLSVAYADTSGSSSSTSSSSTRAAPRSDTAQPPIGDDTDVLRPGADPNDPNDYPYLPSTMAIPVPGPRTEYPQAPSGDSSNTSSTTTPSSSSSGTDTTNNTIMSPSSIASSAPNQSASSSLPDIAIGKPYTIGTHWPDPTFAANESAYASTGQLTDDQYASLNYSDKEWVGLLRQGGRSVVVNLGSAQPIRRLSLDFLQNLGAGIDFPDNVTYYVSDDDETWNKLGTVWSGQGGGDYTPQSQPYTLDTHVTAQYVRAQFDDKVYSFLDEFAVFGVPSANTNAGQQAGSTTQSVDGNQASESTTQSVYGNDGGPSARQDPSSLPPLPGPALTQIMGDDYLVDPNAPGLPNLLQAVSTISSPSGPAGPQGPSTAQSLAQFAALGLAQGASQLHGYLGSLTSELGYLTSSDPGTDGIKNMQLVYTGSNGAVGEWSESDFLPMIAQEDASGKPTGWLFDGTLFGDYSSNTPETKTGWRTWLTDLFSPNVELSALNRSVGAVKQQLNDSSYKEKVVITIPGLGSNPSNFGVVDSSGQSLDLNPNDVGQVQATINKVKAIRWIMQQVLSQWNSANYSNLELSGFYWDPESLQPNQPLDPELIQATAAMVHRYKLKFFWIPYYGAVGIANWRQLGFDDVTSQAGVAFNYNIDAVTRLASVASMAQYYHMGLEMEQPYNTMSTSEAAAEKAQERFYDYFTGGYVYGYEGTTMKTWYLNSKGLIPAYQSTNPFYHQMYDNTVSFVNDLWKNAQFE